MIAALLLAVVVGAGGLTWFAVRDSNHETGSPKPPTSTTEAPVPFEPSPDSAYRSAWLTYWDDGTGLASFKANAKRLDEFHPFWYEVQSATQIVTQGTTAFRQSAIQAAKSAGIKIVPTFTETLKPDAFVAFMSVADKRRQHVQAVCDIAKTNNFDGIDIDYEMFAIKVPQELVTPARDSFSAFIEELAPCLHDAGKTLQVTLLPKTNNDIYAPYLSSLTPGVFDYRRIGAAADFVRPMAYDNATPLTSAGSTDPLPWVRAVGEYARKHIPARKVVLGIALYGYDWTPGNTKSITARQAIGLAKQKGIEVKFDELTNSRYFEYQATDGSTHNVWFNTSSDTAERVKLARELGLAGVSYWALGNEDRDFWNSVVE